MKNILGFILLAFASVASAGGSIGGGTGLVLDNSILLSLVDNASLLREIEVPDLGLQKRYVEGDVYRRTRARLSTSDVTALEVAGEKFEVKAMSGGIVNIEETSQILMEK